MAGKRRTALNAAWAETAEDGVEARPHKRGAVARVKSASTSEPTFYVKRALRDRDFLTVVVVAEIRVQGAAGDGLLGIIAGSASCLAEPRGR